MLSRDQSAQKKRTESYFIRYGSKFKTERI